MAAALADFTGPVVGDEPRHDLVITHNFLYRMAGASRPPASNRRWFGIDHAYPALTVIRYAHDHPLAVLLFKDTGHLPSDSAGPAFRRSFTCEAGSVPGAEWVTGGLWGRRIRGHKPLALQGCDLRHRPVQR